MLQKLFVGRILLRLLAFLLETISVSMNSFIERENILKVGVENLLFVDTLQI